MSTPPPRPKPLHPGARLMARHAKALVVLCLLLVAASAYLAISFWANGDHVRAVVFTLLTPAWLAHLWMTLVVARNVREYDAHTTG